MQRRGGIFPDGRVKGSHIPTPWRWKKCCSCWLHLHPAGQLLRSISKAKATYRKEGKKPRLTTSLSGGLDKSGAHLKAVFMAEIDTALQTSVPWVPTAPVCFDTRSTQVFRPFGKKLECRDRSNIIFAQLKRTHYLGQLHPKAVVRNSIQNSLCHSSLPMLGGAVSSCWTF